MDHKKLSKKVANPNDQAWKKSLYDTFIKGYSI